MCRHFAYWGPRTTPAALALDDPFALVRQCTAAREMSWGNDNLDGWGYVCQSGADAPRSYRSELALDVDENGRNALRHARGDRFLVHVRQKTPGSATDDVNSAPFSDGGDHYFAHNGFVADFRAGVREELLAKISPQRAAAIVGDTDSETLFALVLSRVDEGADPIEATRVVAEVAEIYGGRYNVVLWSPEMIVATRWDNSLYVRDTDEGRVVSSEPTDDSPWTPVAERSMVILTADALRQEEL
jgi:glutamine amidotransferase